MTQTARSSNYRFAIGKQTAEGTAQATPAFEHSLDSGSIEPINTDTPWDLIDSEELQSGFDVTFAGSQGDPVVYGDCDAIGMLLLAHLGVDTPSGAGNYTHVFSRSATKSFLTCYQNRPVVPGGTALWERSVDTFVNMLEFQATKGMPLLLGTGLMAKTHELSVTAPTPTNDRRRKATNTKIFSFIGATLKLDLDTTPAATTVRNVEKLVVHSEYTGAQWIQTDEVFARYLDIGEYRLTASCDLVFQDYAAYSSTFFGTKTIAGATLPGMALSSTAVTGSLDALFQVVGVIDANRSLELAVPSMRWRAGPPKPDKGGAAVRVTLTGQGFAPSSGEALAPTLKNTTATY